MPRRRVKALQQLVLTAPAAQLAPFALAPENELNADTLGKAARRLIGSRASKALPGAEVLLEAEVNGQRLPAAVYRPVGAGKVFTMRSIDSWRVALRSRGSVARQILEPGRELDRGAAFRGADKFVSLDAGAITYRPGESAELRVRLRDGEGRPVSDATVDAVLYRDGKKAATIRLMPDESGSGLFRGKTAALPPGAYEVADRIRGHS